MSLVKKFELRNGAELPVSGLGVYKMIDPHETVKAITTALDIGYRAIDTASLYGNEALVGQAIKASDVKREDLIITTKVWNTDQGYDETLRAFEGSLALLDLDYIDIYLTHWPVPEKYVDTYRAIQRLYDEKLIRAPGVSNHTIDQLEEIKRELSLVPFVNQVEMHPYLQQKQLLEYCQKNKIQVTAWSPLGKGAILEDPIIQKIAQKHHVSPAQIILKWHESRGVMSIPKSVTPERIKENYYFYKLELTTEDLTAIDQLERDGRMGANPSDPHFMNHFKGL